MQLTRLVQGQSTFIKTPLAALSALAAATLTLTGCGSSQASSSAASQASSGKIQVFAAASLNNAGADLEKAY